MRFLLGLAVGLVLGVLVSWALFGTARIVDPAPPPASGGGTETAAAGIGAGAEAPRSARGGVDPETPGVAAGEGEPVTPAPPETIDLVALMRERLVDRAGQLGPPEWEKVLPLLEERREEALPILEDWVRRYDELTKARAGLAAVFQAYAELGQGEAVPLLASFLDRPYLVRGVLEGLGRIDDEAATNVIRSYQDSRKPGAIVAPLREMVRFSAKNRELVWRWAEDPPPERPRLAKFAREILFRFGSPEDRERLWPMLDVRERLGAWIDLRWPAPWPERHVEAARTALSHPDPDVRVAGMMRVVRYPHRYPRALLDEADRVAAADLARIPDGAGEAEEKRRNALRDVRASIAGRRREAERARRVQEALEGR